LSHQRHCHFCVFINLTSGTNFDILPAIPIDPSHRPSPKAIERVAKDLIKREIQIQDDITALMPLMNFASVEPSFGKPFQAAEYLQIARANQLILGE